MATIDDIVVALFNNIGFHVIKQGTFKVHESFAFSAVKVQMGVQVCIKLRFVVADGAQGGYQSGINQKRQGVVHGSQRKRGMLWFKRLINVFRAGMFAAGSEVVVNSLPLRGFAQSGLIEQFFQ